jgi:hypothetical protein
VTCITISHIEGLEVIVEDDFERLEALPRYSDTMIAWLNRKMSPEFTSAWSSKPAWALRRRLKRGVAQQRGSHALLHARILTGRSAGPNLYLRA